MGWDGIVGKCGKGRAIGWWIMKGGKGYGEEGNGAKRGWERMGWFVENISVSVRFFSNPFFYFIYPPPPPLFFCFPLLFQPKMKSFRWGKYRTGVKCIDLFGTHYYTRIGIVNNFGRREYFTYVSLVFGIIRAVE